jgi:ATPase subunit of ABC transporter with duplicated ATPase domains
METNHGEASRQSALVSIEELSLCIGVRKLIDGFTLYLKQGARIGITGPSGCGKTTLLRNVVRRHLSAGSTAERFEVTYRPVGYAPQEGGLLPWYFFNFQGLYRKVV